MMRPMAEMDLTEIVLEEEREIDDEMAEDDGEDGLTSRSPAARDPSVFLNESFADSEDLDDEMDGGDEEEGSGGSGTNSHGEDDDDEGADRKYPCLQCQESFLSKRSLRQHVRCLHLESCFWTCQTCGGVSPDAEAFKVHLVKVHKILRETFALDHPEDNPLLRPCLTIKEDVKACPECELQFANKTSLNVHR